MDQPSSPRSVSAAHTSTYTPVTTPPITHTRSFSSTTRVGNALHLVHGNTIAAGQKPSSTIKALVDRWTALMRMHVKFHADIVEAVDDAQEAATALNGLLSTLEPALVDHGKDFTRAVQKLSRNAKSGHTLAEWDAALRQPFEHLAVYTEWLQRIDPFGKFNEEHLAQVSNLAQKVQTVLEDNQQPRGVIKRFSTFARGVIRRPSTVHMQDKNSATSSPKSPTSPSNAISVTTTEYSYSTSPTPTPTTIVDRPELPPIHAMANTVETVKEVAEEPETKAVAMPLTTTTTTTITSPGHSKQPSITTITTTTTTTDADIAPAIYTATPRRLQQYRTSTNSNRNSIGSMTLAPSNESLNMNEGKPSTAKAQVTLSRQRSAASQKFLEEREARKATLRLGAQAFITSKAESLQAQSPTYVSRPSIDRLRTITRRETETKPPVKSLISFWEQTSDPIEV
ncbi:hypothetical protein BGZ94_000003 [Podila epigama]|nr:hypothetical protein BGZ94_000003 [Podila epigama]